jgi:hypothetical protein
MVSQVDGAQLGLSGLGHNGLRDVDVVEERDVAGVHPDAGEDPRDRDDHQQRDRGDRQPVAACERRPRARAAHSEGREGHEEREHHADGGRDVGGPGVEVVGVEHAGQGDRRAERDRRR